MFINIDVLCGTLYSFLLLRKPERGGDTQELQQQKIDSTTVVSYAH